MKIAHKIASAVFAAATVLTLAGCASTPSQEGTGEYVDDAVLTTKVKASIFNEPSLKSTEINVETFKGTVQLSGFVAQPADISKAGEVARGVKGVKSVKNDIRVK
ncbi:MULTISPECIES: BON domain-containing protein [Telluria group]|uniref:Osmotically-inducible protein Y n=1 Tax=Pseudoduganella violacea TaxID=1715466 RepID=A0A7W5FTH6_9BURK|nr:MULTISPECIES: BON domain-containing protein [Telluria group]AKU21782.1 transporter [Massilia sp. NR 4-1]MBB3118581.1 osmotically-inducible protein OsmY [Pseudoduganella violacea]UMR28596.1 BON domain-containing protein [Massilia sp. MB5]UTY60365.1 BON domain-containing protein [Massilia sp. erpn]